MIRRQWVLCGVWLWALCAASADARAENFTLQGEGPGAEVIHQSGRWTYTWFNPQIGECYISILLPYGSYREYKEMYLQKGQRNDDCVHTYLLGDPAYTGLIATVAADLRSLARQHRVDECALALSFVQSLGYRVSPTRCKYAGETLLDGQGDCCDTSILFAAILRRLGYQFIFLEFDHMEHMAVGLRTISSGPGAYYVMGGRRYYYCETTGQGWRIGDVPDALAGMSARALTWNNSCRDDHNAPIDPNEPW